jgi:hypothetical protein
MRFESSDVLLGLLSLDQFCNLLLDSKVVLDVMVLLDLYLEFTLHASAVF